MELQLAYKAVGVQASATADKKLIGNYFKQGILQKTDLHPFKFANEEKNQLQHAKRL
jgi:hypothetical protein